MSVTYHTDIMNTGDAGNLWDFFFLNLRGTTKTALPIISKTEIGLEPAEHLHNEF